jgi:hypothetical protein
MIEQRGLKSGKDKRAERLAKALRENLKRRKAQAMGRRASESNASESRKAEPFDDNSERT